ncbi:hypothetical protein HDU80_002990, partial [Chytriomyces hyalinus]
VKRDQGKPLETSIIPSTYAVNLTLMRNAMHCVKASKKPATKAAAKAPTKPSKVQAKLEALEQSATNSKKIQVLKTKVGGVELALDNVTE